MERLIHGLIVGTLLVTAIYSMCGCEIEDRPSQPPPTTVKADPQALQYIRDERTNLCFARYSYRIPCGELCVDGSGASITMIPCDALKGVTTAPVEEFK
jgi:hypothetical protein